MWLIPVALAACIGLFFAGKHGWRWTWGMLIQQTIVLLVAIIGTAFLYAPIESPLAVPKEKIATWCAIAAWALFFVFNFGQRMVLNQLSLDLSLFRVQQALARRWQVRLLTWGPPGAYWCDMAQALALYYRHEAQQADGILHAWELDPRMPAGAKDGLVGFLMLGRVLMNDWSGIISIFEQNQSKLAASRSFVPYQMASRAYAEQRQFAEAVECMEKANMHPGKNTALNLDINFMTLFALLGAVDEVNKVLSHCKDRHALPTYVRDYWIGRAYAVRADHVRALDALQRSKSETPREMTIWQERIQTQIDRQERLASDPAAGSTGFASESVVARAESLYRRLRTAADVMRPEKARPAVVTMVVLLIVAHLVSNADQFLAPFFPIEQLQALHKQCYSLGELSAPALLRGQWWRTITYMFLHGNIPHLLLNVFALYIFGKRVEHVYGTARFLVIYFIAGIVSGVLQILIVPNDAAIGASGAILGVFGATISGTMKLKKVLPDHVRKAELRWMVSIAIAQVLFDQLVNGVASVTDKSPDGVRIAGFAHMAGIVAGFLVGMLLPIRSLDEKPPETTTEN